jgi:hypothetical protein
MISLKYASFIASTETTKYKYTNIQIQIYEKILNTNTNTK